MKDTPPRAENTQEWMSAAGLERQISPYLELLPGAVPEAWAPRMAAYLQMLVEANRHVNLVSRKSVDTVVEAQLVPSLAALLVVPERAEIRVLDIGSGGGFPGIPLAILRPAARVDLVDSVGKKCVFLRRVIGELGLRGIRVHNCRVEHPGDELRKRAPFDVAIARAVGQADQLAAAARPLLRKGARLWVFASPLGRPGEIAWPPDNARTALVPAD